MAILAMCLLMWALYREQQGKLDVLPYYPNFAGLVESGKVARCEIVREASGVQFIRGELKPEVEADGAPKKFKVYITDADNDLREFLVRNRSRVQRTAAGSIFWQIVSSVLPVVLIFGLLYFLFVRQIRSAGHGP